MMWKVCLPASEANLRHDMRFAWMLNRRLKAEQVDSLIVHERSLKLAARHKTGELPAGVRVAKPVGSRRFQSKKRSLPAHPSAFSVRKEVLWSHVHSPVQA